MRTTIKHQLPLAQPRVGHPHARELSAISDILDQMPEVLSGVRDDVASGRRTNRGRVGMTAEQVLRVLVLKQMNGFSYQELSFQLASNFCYQAFCRFGAFDSPPKRSTLQQNLKRLSPETLEQINLAIIEHARTEGVEHGQKVRFDCTTVETNIHEPADSTLLWDTVRVLDRLLRRAAEEFGTLCTRHVRVAKRRMVAIMNAGTMKKRVPIYRDLIKATSKTIAYAETVAAELKAKVFEDIKTAILADATAAELLRFAMLGRQVVDQTRRRVLDSESVPADEKIVSSSNPTPTFSSKAAAKSSTGTRSASAPEAHVWYWIAGLLRGIRRTAHSLPGWSNDTSPTTDQHHVRSLLTEDSHRGKTSPISKRCVSSMLRSASDAASTSPTWSGAAGYTNDCATFGPVLKA